MGQSTPNIMRFDFNEKTFLVLEAFQAADLIQIANLGSLVAATGTQAAFR